MAAEMSSLIVDRKRIESLCPSGLTGSLTFIELTKSLESNPALEWTKLIYPVNSLVWAFLPTAGVWAQSDGFVGKSGISGRGNSSEENYDKPWEISHDLRTTLEVSDGFPDRARYHEHQYEIDQRGLDVGA